ncbi:MAG TPA: diguanylate cyclase, partial [Vicinamibacterales bacterium]
MVHRSQSTIAALGAVAVGAAVIPWAAGWVPADRTVHLSALAVLLVLSASLREQERAGADVAMMPPAFVVIFTALMLLGGPTATVFAAAAAVASRIAVQRLAPHELAFDVLTAVAAVQAADQGHRLTGSVVPRAFVWPWTAIPITAAVIAYHLTQSAATRVVAPLVTRRPFDRSWLKHPLPGLAVYLLAAAAAVAIVDVIDHGMWDVAPVLAGALFCAYWIYADYLSGLSHAHRRREVIDFLDQGMSVLDADGRVVLWNDALERMLACPPSRALGRQLTDLVPALARTELPRAIKETAGDREGRILNHLRISAGSETRIVQVKVLPVTGGVSLLWHDVTERTQAEHEIRQRGERLALAAEGANDGLWQWNLQTREFYVSGRWRAMIGLPAHAAIGGPAEWLDRVHPDDITSLNAALEAHLAGSTQVFQHEHRIRHEDGTYRRFLCRGLAVRGAGRKPDRIAGSLTDTTEQAIAQERLRSVGFQDSLTGLFNRAVFVEGLGRRLDECKRRGVSRGFAVLYLDLDRFKIVNDSLGHMVGDELLVAASRRLESCLRNGDALSRLGGDEFAILLSGLNDDAQANAIAGRIQDTLSTPFSIAGREVFTSASIGIAFGPAHYANPDEIMRDADTAMYHAKSRGKARHEVFDADMHARVRDRLSLESDLRRAIASKDFEVHYQPIVSLTTWMCVGFESLVRWNRN